MELIKDALVLLFPFYCLVCGKPLRQSKLCQWCDPVRETCASLKQHRCQKCFNSLLDLSSAGCPVCLTFPPICAQTRYLWEFNDRSKAFIRALKYKPSLFLSHYAGKLLASNLDQLFSAFDWDAIIPVPASREALRKRGFNQCEVFCREIKKRIPKAKLLRGGLRQNRPRVPQAKLKHEKRFANIKKSFSASKKIAGKKVLLVEDVITTGATTAEAACTLYEAGAVKVDIVALTRTAVWERFRALVYKRYAARLLSIPHETHPRRSS